MKIIYAINCVHYTQQISLRYPDNTVQPLTEAEFEQQALIKGAIVVVNFSCTGKNDNVDKLKQMLADKLADNPQAILVELYINSVSGEVEFYPVDVNSKNTLDLQQKILKQKKKVINHPVMSYLQSVLQRKNAQERLRWAKTLQRREKRKTAGIAFFTTLSLIALGLLFDSLAQKGVVFKRLFNYLGGDFSLFYNISSYWLPIVTSLFLFLFTAACALKLKFNSTTVGNWIIVMKVAIAAMLLSWLTDTLAGNGLFSFLFSAPDVQIGVTFQWWCVFVVLVVFTTCFLYLTLPQIKRLNRSLKPESHATKHPAIIFSMSSNQNNRLQGNKLSFKTPAHEKNRCSEVQVELNKTNIEEVLQLLKASKQYNNWETTLRTLAHHQTALEHLVLIGTYGDKGSHKQLATFKRVVNHLLPWVTVTIHEKQIPENSIEEYCKVFESAIDRLNRFGYCDEDVLFDITGGKAPSSAAAAMTSLHRKASFQYVDTNELNYIPQYQMEYIDDHYG